ncbi:MAG: PilZ domain-containing protein [Erythrobacter sp.]
MGNAKPADSTLSVPCLRTYGRMDVALRGYLESPFGRTLCSIRDLSLGGARIETEQTLVTGQSIWLCLMKLKIFGTVKWVQGNLVGIQFEEKLPKSVVLNLRGEVVDSEALAETEAMLAAQNWVIGTPINRPKSIRMADVLGEQAPESSLSKKAPIDRGSNRRAAAVIAFSAAIGLLIGLGSMLIF